MSEFWEKVFRSNEKMWGENPTDNAYTVLKILKQRKVKNLLIPGFGYGRNAKVFHEQNINVSGIEISETAIKRARLSFPISVSILHESVTNMPFDNQVYDAIYCYSVIHLLNEEERLLFIKHCFHQLKAGGIMIFVAISVEDERFGVGTETSKNTFQSPNGLSLYFYDKASINKEFGSYNIIDLKAINEPLNKPTEKCWMVCCEKPT